MTGKTDGADSGSAAARDVAVIGAGHVGLLTALSLLSVGHAVTAVDVSFERIEKIRANAVDLPPGRAGQLREHLASGRLRLTEDPYAARGADAVVICVPTPVDAHLVPDLTGLRAACAHVVATARHGQLLILTSTAHVGATEELLVRPLTEAGFSVGSDVHVAFCPERIDPGRDDAALLPRVVGGQTPACSAAAAALLDPISSATHVVSDPATAEMTRLLENTFRAVNIALVNEFSEACRHAGIDVMEVVRGAETKPYGFMAFRPGAGVGGHCIPCDPHYLLWGMRSRRVALPVTESAMSAIAARPRAVVARVEEALARTAKTARGARVIVLGVTYKEGVADIRESPALQIIRELIEAGAEVSYYDPLVRQLEFEDHVLKTRAPGPYDSWDVALVHTWNPAFDVGWLRAQPVVIDATYSLSDMPNSMAL